MSPVYAFSISSWLEIRQTFQKFTGATFSIYLVAYISEDSCTSALFICMLIIVIQVAREPFEMVLKVNVLF